MGAPRRERRVSQSRRLAHLERLLRLRDPAGQGARAAAPALRGDDLRPRRARLDHGVERRRTADHFEWKAGAIFAIPLNAWHQHFNGSGKEPARYVAVTNAPVIINAFGDLDFVFNTRYDFKERFDGEPEYFANRGEQKGLLLDTNFVADAINLPLFAAKERGAGGGHTRFSMAKGSMNSHISQFPSGTYKKAHAHGPGAHVIVLSGEGYSPDVARRRGAEALRVARRRDDRAAEPLVPPAFQHRHHARRAISRSRPRASRSATPRACPRPGSAGSAATRSTTRTSAASPAVVPEALAKHGLKSHMDKAYAGGARQNCRPSMSPA